MADAATLDAPAVVTPTPAATPNAPVGIPDPPAKLTVPASALGLETTLDKPTTPAAPAKTAEPTETVPASKPADKPAEPATPAAPAKPAAEKPTTPEKIKIGDKEYTLKELEAAVAKPTAPATIPKPAPAAAPAKPAAPTPEQIAAQKAETAKAEQTWVDNFVQKEAINFPMTEDEMETLLSGGKTAVELFGTKLAQVAARSALLARKSMYEDLDPMIANLNQVLTPLLTNHQDVARIAAETQFTAAYPEFKPHMEMVREFANGLQAQFPQQVAAMTQEQFAQEVAAQVDAELQAQYKRWSPGATDTWKEFAAKQAAAAATAAQAAAAAAAAPVKPAAPAAPAKPKVLPPAVNAPAAIAAPSSPDFHKSVAKDLQD